MKGHADQECSLVRFPRAVPRGNGQPGDEHDVHDLVIAGGLVNDHLAPGRRQSDEVFVLDGHASAVCKMNDKRSEWVYVKQLANVVNFHAGNLRRARQSIKLLPGQFADKLKLELQPAGATTSAGKSGRATGR